MLLAADGLPSKYIAQRLGTSQDTVRVWRRRGARRVDPRCPGPRAQTPSLRRLAEQTGGVAFTDSNQFRGALERIVRENSAYFLLGYRAPRETPDGKEHQIRIEVDRPGVRVRARRSYVADSEPVVQRPF